MLFLPERLKNIRIGLDISKTEAARRLHITAMGYGRYESGERVPSYPAVCHMAHILGTSKEYLYGLSDDPAPKEILLSEEEDPEFYALVCKLQRLDRSSRSRLIAYYIRLMDAGNAADMQAANPYSENA